jgi:hypothetical protein
MKQKTSLIKITFVILAICISLQINILQAQDELSDFFPDIKIRESNNPAPGYFFLASKGLTAENACYYIAIVDNYGTPVFFRKLNGLAVVMRPLPDGRIAYMSGTPRKLYFLDPMLKTTHFIKTIGYKTNAHDWAFTSDGHIVLMGRSSRTVDMSQIADGGNPNAEVLDLIIQEFDADENLIFTWNSADHFSILDANENSPFVDFTETQIDYVHANSIAIDSDTSIIVSSRHMDEITKIDRRTGDIIWRFGGKNNDFTFINDTRAFSHQHSIHRLNNGNILLFDNGNLHTELYSSAVEYEIDEVNMTATLIQRIRRNPDIYCNHGSGTQRIHNKNTLIAWGPYWPSATEFNPDGSPALELDFTHHSFSPKIEKFMWKTKVFETNTDTIHFGIRDGNNPITQTVEITNNSNSQISITSCTSHTQHFSINTTLPLEILAKETAEIVIEFSPVDMTYGYMKDIMNLNYDTETERIACQLVLIGQQSDDISPTATITPTGDNVLVDTIITITFSEPVRITAGTELNYSNIDEYCIFKEDDVNGSNVQFNANINTEKNRIEIIPDATLINGTQYYVSFSPDLEDYSGNPVTQTDAVFTIEWLASIENPLEDADILVYPNPANNFITIAASNPVKTVTVFSIFGNQIYTIHDILSSNIKINFHDLSSGLYFIQIEDNKYNRLVKKLVIKK